MNELEAKPSNNLTPSRKENEQSRHARDHASSFVRKDTSEAIPNPVKTNSQRHFSAPDAALRHADLDDDPDYELLNPDPKTPPPPSRSAPSTSPSPLEYDLDLHNTYNEEKDDDAAPIVEIRPAVSTVASHDHTSDHHVHLLFDLEFDDYSDAVRLSQEVIPPRGPAHGSREEWVDPVDEAVAYIMGITVGE